MIKNKKRQFNVRLDDLNFSRIELLKEKLHCDSNTVIIDLALNSLCDKCDITIDEIVNNMDKG